jgi:hypothetical protein
MGRSTVTIVIVAILLILVALLTLSLSTTNCPSLFFCSPDPTALLAGILFLIIWIGARIGADLAGGGSKSQPPPDD